jgi:hypothetical protein
LCISLNILCNKPLFLKKKQREFARHGMDDSQGGVGNEISRQGTSKASFHNASGGKFII